MAREPKIDPRLIELIVRATREPDVEMIVDDPQLADQQMRKYIKYLGDKGDNLVVMLPPYKIQRRPGAVAIVWKYQANGEEKKKFRRSNPYIDKLIKQIDKALADSVEHKDAFEMLYTQRIAAQRWNASYLSGEEIDESCQRVVECCSGGQRFLDLVYEAFTNNLEPPILEKSKREDGQDIPTDMDL